MDNQNTTQTTKSYFDIILEKTKSIKIKKKALSLKNFQNIF